MLAFYLDGDDSAFGVLRFVDAATHETAEFHMELTVYANTLRYLYMEGHATKFGFTRYALQNVARRRVFFVKGVPRNFGGPDVLATSTNQRCMERMMSWASLSLATIPSEFPEFDVRQSLCAFDITDRCVAHLGNDNHDRFCGHLFTTFGTPVQERL